MNIILTSAGIRKSAIQQDILRILPKPPNELKLAHIITASQVVEDAPFADKDRAVMDEWGFDVTDILLEDLAPDTTFTVLNEFDIIYVQAGNGFYLLKQARACGFEHALRKILEDESKWYIGASAGSYIACPTIEMHTWKGKKDQHGVNDLTAMNLVPFLLVAHYDREKHQRLLAEHIPTASAQVRILTDDQAFVVRDGVANLIGDGPEILLGV